MDVLIPNRRATSLEGLEGSAIGVSAHRLYGFGPIILQSHRREAGEARGVRAADMVSDGRAASAALSV